ncbi:MAG TPA: hypothetical protein VMT31_05445 [Methanomicrobiales archaeon]|jgi:hypothetical protein|nr:hypothetical protein [Methanomicrobiales archaeon]
MAKGLPGQKGVKRGVQDVVTILDGYDTFHWSRNTLGGVADFMILLAVLTLAGVLWNRGALSAETTAGLAAIDLSLVLFGLSAIIFAIFRAVLFMIEDYMEKAVNGVHGIKAGQFSSGGRGNLKTALDSVSSRLQDSITVWYTARAIVIRAAYIIIPGILFYLLGIANLVMYLVGRGLLPGP